jgi:arginyl-tRNA synthetase
VRFPDNGYRGDYVYDIARALRARTATACATAGREIIRGPAGRRAEGGDKEKHIDALIGAPSNCSAMRDYRLVFDPA